MSPAGNTHSRRSARKAKATFSRRRDGLIYPSTGAEEDLLASFSNIRTQAETVAEDE